MTPVVLRPLRVTRIGILVSGGIIAAGGTVVAVLAGREGVEWVAMGALTALLGLVVAVRSGGLSLELHDDAAVVRGLLWSRAVPRAAITGVTRFPSIVWRDDAGRERRTPVNALNVSSGAAEPIRRNAESGVEALRRWAGVGPAS